MNGQNFSVDLILGMLQMDVILGMDWLSRYGAKMNCRDKLITLSPIESDIIQFQGDRSLVYQNVLSVLRAEKL